MQRVAGWYSNAEVYQTSQLGQLFMQRMQITMLSVEQRCNTISGSTDADIVIVYTGQRRLLWPVSCYQGALSATAVFEPVLQQKGH